MFHQHWRDAAVRGLVETFDLIVVGGGITGCGIALDAAQRGLRTVLLERGDIASGTSSRSSKLIHGGLRYLRQMQLRITRLACRERDRLLDLNPHLVQPIRFLYPTRFGDETPGWKIDFGLWMYDQLTGRPEKHGQLSAAEVEEVAPGLSTERLDRALHYADAMADDARLTLAVAATAQAYGAAILSRCELLEGTRNDADQTTTVVARDLESGKTLTLAGRVVVNASGVWTDVVRERFGITGATLRPSRGVHLILPTRLLPIKVAVTIPSPDDGRPVFLIPHPEGVLFGTTDIYAEGPLDDPRPTAAEIDYLLRAALAAFPGRALDRSSVSGAFAGLRPILDTHAEDPSEASREEDIWHERGILSVAGGKLTTWRATAESAVDAALELLPEERSRLASRCATPGTALAGLAPRDLGPRLATELGLEPAVAAGAARRLGALAWHLPLLAGRPADLAPLADATDLSPAEVYAHIRWGAVLHLDDLLLRRVRIGMWQPDLALHLLPALRPVLAAAAGWDGSRWDREEETFRQALEGWTLGGVRG